LFTVFINDLEEKIPPDLTICLKFADDTKVGQTIDSTADQELLQRCLDDLVDWAATWGMQFNIEKCHVVHIGRNNPRYSYTMAGTRLIESDKERDIGVIISENLKQAAQCEKAANKATSVLGQILRAFTYRDSQVLPKVFKTYVRPHLEFASPAWAPWQAGDIERMEAVQKRMVRQVTGLTSITYEGRLEELGLTTLEKRRQDLDLVHAYKVIRGHDEVAKSELFQMLEDRGTRRTEGGLSVVQEAARTEVRRNFFSLRTAGRWNDLPAEVKMSKNVNEFKRKLCTARR